MKDNYYCIPLIMGIEKLIIGWLPLAYSTHKRSEQSDSYLSNYSNFLSLG